MVIYTEFLYVSVRGIILSIKLETILHTTTHGQLTSLNTCALHHGYIYRISVCFSSRYNSEYQTRNYIAYYDPWPVNVSKHMCTTPWLYIQNFCMFHYRYNSEYQTRNYIAYYDPRPVNVSKHMCTTPWLYIQNLCMFHYRYNSEYQTRNYIAYYDPMAS